MSKLRGKLIKEKSTDVIIVIMILVSATIIFIPYLVPNPPPETTLHILSRDDVSITYQIEEAFLNSSFAKNNNIGDIEWYNPGIDFWDSYSQSGEIDLVMGDETTINALTQSNSLSEITSLNASEIPDSIAGVPMKGDSEERLMWCCYSIRPIIFELLVNETLLDYHGISTPEKIEDLLIPDFWPSERNSSLIGMDFLQSTWLKHQFHHLVTKMQGWDNGIQNLTALYANSQILFDDETLSALENGEISAVLTAFSGQTDEVLPSTISRVHLKDMVIIQPFPVAIASGTTHITQAESFLDFLFSPQGQSILLKEEFSPRLPVRVEAFDFVQGEVDDIIYSEFNWTMRAGEIGVTDTLLEDDYMVWLYMNSTIFSTISNTTHCWRNIIDAYRNSSIDQLQFNQFRGAFGEPLTIVDPITHENESFTEFYSASVFSRRFQPHFATELAQLWRVAANERYQTIVSQLALLV
ncbi:MAG: substrate-binding domain-containing protein [Candidatus Thorarchaeota archaeon]